MIWGWNITKARSIFSRILYITYVQMLHVREQFVQPFYRYGFSLSALSITRYSSEIVPPDIVLILLSDFQAPASDREYRATLPETASIIDLASTMINEGRGSELMPREANPDSPITAYRWLVQLYVLFTL